jgi:hypothetical protein
MAELGLVGDGPNSYQVLHLPLLPNSPQPLNPKYIGLEFGFLVSSLFEY